jgi:predicted nucleic acid-binding protein
MIDMLRRGGISPSMFDHLISPGSSISAMTYGELWDGIVHHPRRTALSEFLDRLLAPLVIHPVDVETALHYGEIRSRLRQRGLMIGSPDILIASTAIRHGVPLVTRNHRHFSRVPNLDIITPSDLHPTD